MKEISEKEVREIKQELDNIKSVAMIKWPFFASLLRKCRIIADPTIPTACVNIRNEMRINPQFLKKLNDKAKVFTYGHEVGHIAFYHPHREGDRTHWIFNMAADSVINALLFAHGFEDVHFPFDLVTPERVAPLVKKKEEEIARMGAEEQYHLLEKHCKTPPFNIMDDLSQKEGQEDKKSSDQDKKDGSQTGGESEKDKAQKREGKQREGTSKTDGESKDESKGAKVIQEGDPEAYGPQKTPEEVEKYWKETLIQAALQAKMAGRLPADAERIINDLLKAKVDWKRVIKKEILDGIGKGRISTWKRTSRKHPLLPGIKQLTKPTAWLLIDTSLSTTEMLPQFLGEIYSILKNQGKGIIIPWDAQAYPPVELSKAVDLSHAIKEKKIRGGGGTVIAPVLKAVLESMKQGDIVVVITDGEIYDIAEKETQELLQKVAQKSYQPIFGTVNTNIPLPLRWRKIKIEV